MEKKLAPLAPLPQGQRVAQPRLTPNDRVRTPRRPLIMHPPIEHPTRQVLSRAPPLLEEESDAGGGTLVADAAHPIRLHWPGAGAALAADDYPRDAGQIK